MSLPDGFPAIDFDEYHRVVLPGLLAGERAGVVRRATAHLRGIGLTVPGAGVFTYRPRQGAVDILAGDGDADTLLELDLEGWQGLVHELEAPAGLLYAGRVRCLRGDAVDLMAWESALRALYNGRPPYEPAEVCLNDGRGEPLDLERTFALGGDAAEMSHFLETAGYLFVRDVLTAAEVARLAGEAAELRAEAQQGDKLSWWGRNAAGEEVLCRVTRGSARPGLASLRDDPRMLRLRDLADERMVYRRGEGEGVAVIYKNPGMVQGLGDLPWHRDCGMGGHATMCPILVVSIYLSEASPESGELTMLPGSHRAAFNAHDPRRAGRLPSAHFHARPGDVSVHFSDTVHAAPPPAANERDSYRVSAVIGFAYPSARHHRGEGSYNDVLHRREDGQVEHLVDVARRLA
jgi:ectoine hydroxylase-related dioxygenase (phytanoyl-CoA dioxygenase family)